MRQAIRAKPRKGLTFSTVILANAAHFEAILYEAQGRAYAVAENADIAALSQTNGIGDSILYLDTTDKAFVALGLLIIIDSATQYEVLQAQTVYPDRIVLKRPSLRSWKKNTPVYPASMCRIAENQTLTWYTAHYAGAKVTFEYLSAPEMEPYTAAETYRGYDVFAPRQDWNDGVEVTYERGYDKLDNGNAIYIDDRKGRPEITRTVNIRFFSRSATLAFIRWLYAIKGRLTPFYLPTLTNDIELISAVIEGSTALDIKPINYAQRYYFASVRDIRIRLKDGRTYNRRILAGNWQVTTEGLTIDTGLNAFGLSDVLMIHFMSLVRLDTDRVEIDWLTPQVARVSFAVRNVGDGA